MMVKAVIFGLLVSFPILVSAQASQVITYLDGDWNADGVPDRTFLMGFENSDSADIAIYLGNPETGEQTLAAHMEDVFHAATSEGRPKDSMPRFETASRDGFRLITENMVVGERATYTILWRGSEFVVSAFMREVFNEQHPEQGFTCIADYSTRKASFTMTGSANAEIFDIPDGAGLLEDWNMMKIPEYCMGF